MDSTATPPTFKTATAADVPAIVALIESAYRGDSSRAGWTSEADLIEGQRTDAEDVLAVVTKPQSRLILVGNGAGLVACCQLEHRKDYAYFGMFAVRPDVQGAGLGKVVLAEAERFAYEVWDVPEIRMRVISARADLVGWYVRRGYERTGQMLPFPYGDKRAGRPTRDDLEFELLTKKLS